MDHLTSLRRTGRSTRGYLKSALHCCRNPGVAVPIRDHYPSIPARKNALRMVSRVLDVLDVPHSVNDFNNTIIVHPFPRSSS